MRPQSYQSVSPETIYASSLHLVRCCWLYFTSSGRILLLLLGTFFMRDDSSSGRAYTHAYCCSARSGGIVSPPRLRRLNLYQDLNEACSLHHTELYRLFCSKMALTDRSIVVSVAGPPHLRFLLGFALCSSSNRSDILGPHLAWSSVCSFQRRLGSCPGCLPAHLPAFWGEKASSGPGHFLG